MTSNISQDNHPNEISIQNFEKIDLRIANIKNAAKVGMKVR